MIPPIANAAAAPARPARFLRLAVAAVAASTLFACASDKATRKDIADLRADLQAMSRENAALSRRIDELSERVDGLSGKGDGRAPRSSGRTGASARGGGAPAATTDDAQIPAGLEVVKVQPQKRGRVAPPVPTHVALVEPDAQTMATLGPRHKRELVDEAQADLAAAHALSGPSEARALVRFARDYPRHPSADNALLEAAQLYAQAGDPDEACALLQRSVDEYPASDSLPDALWELAQCHLQRGRHAQAEGALKRLANDYPQTPAGRRAAARLGATAGADDSPRQGATP